jgi:hypothetical protein
VSVPGGPMKAQYMIMVIMVLSFIIVIKYDHECGGFKNGHGVDGIEKDNGDDVENIICR